MNRYYKIQEWEENKIGGPGWVDVHIEHGRVGGVKIIGEEYARKYYSDMAEKQDRTVRLVEITELYLLTKV